MTKQVEESDFHAQLVDLQHLPSLQVLYLQSEETDVILEEADMDTVYLHLCAQFLRQHRRSLSQEFVLERVRVQENHPRTYYE